MIATLAEIKVFLGISGSTQDALITAYLPIVEDDIVEYCNNNFIAKDLITNCPKIEYSATNQFAFVDSDPDTITDSESAFVTQGFVSGDSIYVSNTIRNDGHYTVDTVSAGTLTLNSLDSLVAEAASDDTTPIISMVIWAKPLKSVYSQMIGYMIYQANDSRGTESESLGDYSVKYSKNSEMVGANMYPKNIVSGLSAYKYLRMS